MLAKALSCRGVTMSQPIEFVAIIEDAGGGGTFVVVPFDVEARFGKKRVKVKATIDGVPYRGSLMRMGGPCHMLGVLKEIREQLGKRPGDQVCVVLEEDTEPRLVQVPEDLRQALDAQPDAGRFFDGLSYTHQKEYVGWVAEARRPETREKRILKVVEMLRQGIKAR
jgi:bifunctional DNA-binding transcriptional regulator/antitoxin component of YhaV-PrlF toxin-antitoxin module